MHLLMERCGCYGEVQRELGGCHGKNLNYGKGTTSAAIILRII